ncbi:MAG: YtxH domain-containing protein [Parachlamydiales bacterium]|jgi:gas vesicle protein
MYHERNSIGFLKGALLGGLAAGITGLLLAPRSGRELRNGIVDGYNSVSQSTSDFADELRKRGHHLFHGQEEETSSNSSMLIGLACGGILTAIVTLLLAPESGSKLRARLGNQYCDIREKAEDFVHQVGEKGHDAVEHLEDWKDTLLTIVNKLNSSSAKKGKSEVLEQIMDWAGLGLNVLHQLQKRR